MSDDTLNQFTLLALLPALPARMTESTYRPWSSAVAWKSAYGVDIPIAELAREHAENIMTHLDSRYSNEAIIKKVLTIKTYYHLNINEGPLTEFIEMVNSVVKAGEFEAFAVAYPSLPGIVKLARKNKWNIPDRFKKAYL